MSADHTPGPWIVDDRKCNLRLIAAAPDLLAALERLANAVTAHRQAITIRALDELCDAEDNARDQIAKAKGGQP